MNPEGIPTQSPRLAHSGYLGNWPREFINLNEVAARLAKMGHNHVVVDAVMDRVTQGSAHCATLG